MEYIESKLLSGAENAIDQKTLLSLTGFKSVREMQKRIEFERRQGVLILCNFSPQGGYFLPCQTDSEQAQHEISTFYGVLRAKVLSTLYTLKHAREALNLPPDEQLKIDDWEMR